MLVVEAMPPLVANPNTVMDADAVGVPEPNLTLLHTAAIVAEAVKVALPPTTNTLFADVVALAEGLAYPSLTLVTVIVLLAVELDVALDSLILEPFAVVLTLVVEEPLMRAEPSGTRLALALTAETTVTVAPLS